MFCPVCKAEYRPGFTFCSDCGIDLVEVAPRLEERFAAIRANAPPKYDELLAASKVLKITRKKLSAQLTALGRPLGAL